MSLVRLLFILIVASFVVVMEGTTLFAHPSGSDVGVIVCGSTSSITIDSHQDTSTVHDKSLLLQGSVDQASQIEVYVDEHYYASVQVPAGKREYNVAIELLPGKHVVRLVALHACSEADAGAQIVVTYTPLSHGTSHQSTGNSTLLPSGQQANKYSSGSEQGDAELGLERTDAQPPAVATMKTLFAWLGIAPHDKTEAASPENFLGILKVGAFIVGMAICLFGLPRRITGRLSAWHRQFWPRLCGVMIACMSLLL